MAVGYLTTDTLIESIKRKALIPSNQKTFKDADFLAFANEEIDMGLVPSVLQFHEEYFSYEETVPLVSNQSVYAIPYRSIGGKFRDVAYKDVTGNLLPMTRIAPEDRVNYNTGDTSVANYYYLRGNDVILIPSLTTAVGSLVFLYYLRPNDMVSEDRIGVVVSSVVNPGNSTQTIITLDSLPTNLKSGKIDILQSRSGHKTEKFDVTVLATDSIAKTITIATTDIPFTLLTGDHIASAGECIIPQIPSDLHPILAQRVAARCLEALGDSQGLSNANSKLQEMEHKTGTMIDNRSEGNPQKVVNRGGFLNATFRNNR